MTDKIIAYIWAIEGAKKHSEEFLPEGFTWRFAKFTHFVWVVLAMYAFLFFVWIKSRHEMLQGKLFSRQMRSSAEG